MSVSPVNGFDPEEHEAYLLVAKLLSVNPAISDDRIVSIVAEFYFAEWRDLPYGKATRRISDADWDRLQEAHMRKEMIPHLREHPDDPEWLEAS